MCELWLPLAISVVSEWDSEKIFRVIEAGVYFISKSWFEFFLNFLLFAEINQAIHI